MPVGFGARGKFSCPQRKESEQKWNGGALRGSHINAATYCKPDLAPRRLGADQLFLDINVISAKMSTFMLNNVPALKTLPVRAAGGAFLSDGVWFGLLRAADGRVVAAVEPLGVR